MVEHKIEAEAIKKALERAQKILLISHKKPDADTLGSTCAWIHFLKDQGKHVSAFCADPIPLNLRHLPASQFIETDTGLFTEDFDIIMTNDCADLEYAGIDDLLGNRDNTSTTVINIDHHATNPHYGNINLIIANASSTTEIITRLFSQWNVELTQPMADNLLHGIITDTDSMMNPATSYQSLVVASDLVRAGADLHEIVQRTLYTKSIADLRLWGLVLSRIKKNEKYNIVMAYLTDEDFKKLNVSKSSAEGIANFMSLIPDINAIVLLLQNNAGYIKGSMRSIKDSIDVGKLAQHIAGGGGHRKASGFTVQGTLRVSGNDWTIE